jgi:hypothetical protein
MHKNILLVLSTITAIIFTGCATKTTKLNPKPISKEENSLFNEYTCNQINNSLSILEKKAQRLARIQNENAASDKVLTSWSFLYGVPLLFLNGDGKEKEEFEIVLGQKEAFENILIKKDCQLNNKSTEFILDTNTKY